VLLMKIIRPNSRVMMDSLNSPVLQRAKLGKFAGIGQELNGDEWSKVWIANLKQQDALEAGSRQKELAAH